MDQSAEFDMSRKEQRGARKALVVGTVTAVLGGICIVCCLLSVALTRASIAPHSPSIYVCAGLMTTPRWRVGVAWHSPISSYHSPLAASPYAICGHVPWPRIPHALHGEWMLPP